MSTAPNSALAALRRLLHVERGGWTTCTRCATPVPPRAAACPLCSLVTPAVATPLDRLRDRGLLEIGVVAVVATCFVVVWTVLWLTR